jgi:hypothetical protein
MDFTKWAFPYSLAPTILNPLTIILRHQVKYLTIVNVLLLNKVSDLLRHLTEDIRCVRLNTLTSLYCTSLSYNFLRFQLRMLFLSLVIVLNWLILHLDLNLLRCFVLHLDLILLNDFPYFLLWYRFQLVIDVWWERALMFNLGCLNLRLNVLISESNLIRRNL